MQIQNNYSCTGPSQAGRPGGHVSPHFLADQLTLSQPGGAHYPHQVLCAPPRFSDLATALHMYIRSQLKMAQIDFSWQKHIKPQVDIDKSYFETQISTF